MNKALLISVALFSSLSFAQSDQDFDVSPAITFFGAVDLGSESAGSLVTFKNTQSSGNLSISGSAQLTGTDADQFEIVSDGCGSQTLGPGASCAVEVRFAPSKYGSHLATLVLNTPGDGESPVMSAFLSSEEDTLKEAERRLPAVIFALDLPASHNAGSSLDLNWSVLGYHGIYDSTVALFDCTGIVDGSCGDDFSDNVWNSSALTANSSAVAADWRYQGESATQFNYSVNIPSTVFSSLPSGNTDVVVRFYSKSNEDKLAAELSTSLIIPGNLGVNYYDSEGRRIILSVSN